MQIFTREGYEVSIALDEVSVRAAMGKKKPDVIIVDITKSPSRALYTLDILGEDARNRTIVIASQPDVAHLRCLSTNVARDFITKPFAMAELLTRVVNMVKPNRHES